MSFLDSILSIFRGKPQPAPAAPARRNSYSNTTSSNLAAPAGEIRANKNVYDLARKVPVPEWAEGLNSTQITESLRAHIKCKYIPSFGLKKIMTTKMGPDGNLIPEYDGIAGDCGAVKTFGMAVAQRDGRTAPYKYVDLNMAYRCCCGIPKKCPFLLLALGEMDAVSSRRA